MSSKKTNRNDQDNQDDQDYPYIRKWGKMVGSMKYYIDQEVERARQENAPQNAVYRGSEYSPEQKGRWITIDEVTNPDTFVKMGLPIPERLHYYLTARVFKYFDNAEERDKMANAIYNYLEGLGLNPDNPDDPRFEFVVHSKDYTPR